MKKLVCEFTGTMMLVLLACGVAVASNVSYIGTSLAFGLVIAAPLVGATLAAFFYKYILKK